MKTYKPGQSIPRSGEYEVVGPRGGRTGEERTGVQHKTFPPTPKPSQEFRLVRPAHNGAGRKDGR